MNKDETYSKSSVEDMLYCLFKTNLKATSIDTNGQLILQVGIFKWKDGSFHNISENEK